MRDLPQGALHRVTHFILAMLLSLYLLLPPLGATHASALFDTKTVVTVTTTADTVDGTTTSFAALNTNPGADKAISLREALLAANATSANSTLTINFNISTKDPGYANGVWTITPKTAKGTLPPLKHGRLTIDGTTQPGAATPAIVLEGLNDSTLGSGLTITSTQNVVQGLQVQHFYDEGIVITNGSNNQIIRCVLQENGDDGLLITDQSSSNVITGSTVLNNYAAGIELRGGPTHSRIGGSTADQRNIISGNGYAGVLVSDDSTTDTVVAGNWIGLDQTGTQALLNKVAGVRLVDSQQTTIGGTDSGAGNIISGNDVGISIEHSADNTVAGNTIGLAADGVTSLANTNGGIFVRSGTRNNVIGGTLPAARNIIAGNGSASSGYGQGIYITDADTSNNVVQGNYIGLVVNSAGTSVARGNTSYGVQISFNANNNVIGGTAPGSGNVISGNGLGGVRLDASSNRVAGNVIGAGADGTTPLPNLNNGVRVRGNDNIIGPGNLIAFHPLSGVVLSGQNVQVISNTLTDNDRSGVCVIGADAVVTNNSVNNNGTSPGPWTECPSRGGITIEQASRANVQANAVYNNQGAGIMIQGGASNQLQENSISNNDQGIALVSGGNNSIAAPVIQLASSTNAAGTSCAGCRIEVYSDPSDQGRYFVGTTSAQQNGTFAITFAPEAIRAQHLTATQTDANGNTSSFALPIVPAQTTDPTASPIDQPAKVRVLLPLIVR